jgi:hypothetical protein
MSPRSEKPATHQTAKKLSVPEGVFNDLTAFDPPRSSDACDVEEASTVKLGGIGHARKDRRVIRIARGD